MTSVNDLFLPGELHYNVEAGFVREQRHPQYPHLAIYNYTPAAVYENVWNDVTRQCRGLIVDRSAGGFGKVIARPLPKFWSAEQLEGRPDLGVIPATEPFRIFDKADGSLGIVYYKPDGDYAMATRGSFTSDQAELGTQLLYEHPICDELRRHEYEGLTLLFEIVGPSNRIVLEYPEDALLLLGGVNIATGQFYPPSEVGNGYLSVEEYHSAVLQEGDRPNKEGYVLWWPHNDFRVKVKHDEYKRLHAIVTMANTKTVWRALMEGARSELMDLPDEFLEPVKKLIAQFEAAYKAIEVDAKLYYHIVTTDFETRKEQAEYLCRRVVPIVRSVVFRMLDDKPYEQAIWKYLEPEQAEPIWGSNETDDS